MKTEPIPSDREVLAGLVERVTYQNADNGFCVIRVKARGHRDLITVVGHAAVISAGEWITAAGEWTNDRTHGQQFKARFLKTSAPTSVEGIAKYLGSGMIRGIGPFYARNSCAPSGRRCSTSSRRSPVACATWTASARCGRTASLSAGPSRADGIRTHGKLLSWMRLKTPRSSRQGAPPRYPRSLPWLTRTQTSLRYAQRFSALAHSGDEGRPPQRPVSGEHPSPPGTRRGGGF
jgi:hypothetical protein